MSLVLLYSQFHADKYPWRAAGHPETNRRITQIAEEVSQCALATGEDIFQSVSDNKNTGQTQQIAQDKFPPQPFGLEATLTGQPD